jgi:hypothetical protein
MHQAFDDLFDNMEREQEPRKDNAFQTADWNTAFLSNFLPA